MLRLLVCPIVGLLALSALAQEPEYENYYDEGRASFSYEQTPFPSYSGTFEAEGPALPLDGTFPPGQTEAVGGFMAYVTEDSVQTAFYAAVANDDGTYDLALAAIRTLGLPTPGLYPVDVLNGTGVFGFVDDAANIDLPDTLDQQHLMAWLNELPATHKLVSASGQITLAAADADTLYGSFAGLTAELDGGFFFVDVEDGQFNLSGADVAMAAPPATHLVVPMVPAPNPFNPQTVLHFTLPEDGPAEVRVYDAAGRRVRTLFNGFLSAGPHGLAWNGADDDGRGVAAGTYLVRAAGAGWETSVSVTLVP